MRDSPQTSRKPRQGPQQFWLPVHLSLSLSLFGHSRGREGASVDFEQVQELTRLANLTNLTTGKANMNEEHMDDETHDAHIISGESAATTVENKFHVR